MNLVDCEGYKKLEAAVKRDEDKHKGAHNYRSKLDWIIRRVEHYAEKTGCSPCSILNAWEDNRNYWYMNYYQDGKQPEIKGHKVRVFTSVEDFRLSVGNAGFRCPKCEGVSRDPQECTLIENCDWKSFGLFGTLGKGVHVFFKSDCLVSEIFMPVAWEAERNLKQCL